MDSRRWFLAGYLSALPEYSNRHPETMLGLADNILRVLRELMSDEVDESSTSIEETKTNG